MTLRNIRLVTTTALVCLLALLSACGGDSSTPPTQQSGGIQRVTADWLAQQPGVTAGDFSLHLLDSDNHPLPWRGLTVKSDGSDLTVEAGGNPPEDAYIYVTYPSERLAFSSAELDAGRADDYLIIATPGRIPGVLPVGVARIAGSRGRTLDGGALLRIRFAAGAERSVSAVTTDPATAPVLTLGPAVGDKVELNWEERNLGDYDNNGVVTIADLSPLGKYFLQSVNGDPKLVIVDGDENGQLTIADISKIGKNVGTQLTGYAIRRTPTAEFTITRSEVFNATPEAERKQRLQYTYQAPFVAATANTYTVVPLGDGNEGPASNEVVYTAGSGNLPPVWDSSEGITAVLPITGGLRLTFGSASDPEGGPVEYILRYNDAPKAPGAADATEVLIPSVVTSGSPPYSYDLMGLSAGVAYNLRINARDQEGLLSTNSAAQGGTVPGVGLSADPWSQVRGSATGTGSNPTASAVGPLEMKWSKSVYAGSVGYAPFTPVVGANGRIYVSEPGGDTPYVFDSDGTVLPSPTGIPSTIGDLALDGGFLVASNNGGVSVYDVLLGSSYLAVTTAVPNGRPILLSNYAVVTGPGSLSAALVPWDGEQWNYPFLHTQSFTRAPVSDGTWLWHANDIDRVVRLDPFSGLEADSRSLSHTLPAYCNLAVDAQRRLLYLVASDALLILDADTLNDVGSFPLTNVNENSTITLVQSATPPVALVSTFDSGASTGTLQALDVTDPATPIAAWSSTFATTTYLNVTAGASRIFAAQRDSTIGGGDEIRILDFSGVVRQHLMTGGDVESEPIPVGDSVYAVVDEELRSFSAVASDLPPVWQGVSAKPGGGIRELTENSGTLTVSWDYATDDHGAPVYYAVYWRELLPPDFNNPGPDTHVITDIADNGTGSHSIDFDPGSAQRVYVGVRAYDAPWAQPHQIDSNTNWLAVTPGWAREELVTGAQLPAGEIYFMRGAPRNDGSLGLSYYDTNTQHITYVYGNTGGWSYENNPFTSWTVNALDLTETANGARMAICDSSAAALNRTGLNAWTRLGVQGATDPELNPQISIARSGAQGALAYNEHVAGNFPNPETHYFSSFLSGGQWQPAQEIDDQNFSGRDLAMTYCQGNPLVAYELGGLYAPNRLTPLEGILRMARWNGTSWDRYNLDFGDNGGSDPASDCGKRIKVAANGDIIHMAYMDLNAQAPGGDARGQLKYGVYDPVANTFNITLLSTFDLTIQPGSDQYTWGELGLTLSAGEPVISFLSRDTGPSGTQPHYGSLWLWDHRGGSWNQTRLGDNELLFPSDREPCFILRDGAGKLHAFFASSTKDIGQGPVCDKLVHVYEK